MSQIYFNTPDGGEVLTGYDYPLNYVHLTVFDREGDVIYSELDGRGFAMTAADVLPTLERLGITAPAGLLPLLEEHVANKVRNLVLRL